MWSGWLLYFFEFGISFYYHGAPAFPTVFGLLEKRALHESRRAPEAFS